jgi:GNAT superfamily N-acetyltransferase
MKNSCAAHRKVHKKKGNSLGMTWKTVRPVLSGTIGHELFEAFVNEYVPIDPTLHDDERVGEHYRLALGNRIDPLLRESLTPRAGEIAPCGRIGFADVSVRGATHFQPRQFTSALADQQYIAIILFGIEPQYQRSGHGSALLHSIESCARNAGLAAVIAESVPEVALYVHELLASRGYEFGTSADRNALLSLNRSPVYAWKFLK